MKHSRCGDQLHEVAFLTFRYWYCRTCKDEIPPDQWDIEVADLPKFGWHSIMHDGERCWTFDDHEFGVVIDDRDAIGIHKLMAKGMDFGDALIKQIFPDDP